MRKSLMNSGKAADAGEMRKSYMLKLLSIQYKGFLPICCLYSILQLLYSDWHQRLVLHASPLRKNAYAFASRRLAFFLCFSSPNRSLCIKSTSLQRMLSTRPSIVPGTIKQLGVKL